MCGPVSATTGRAPDSCLRRGSYWLLIHSPIGGSAFHLLTRCAAPYRCAPCDPGPCHTLSWLSIRGARLSGPLGEQPQNAFIVTLGLRLAVTPLLIHRAAAITAPHNSAAFASDAGQSSLTPPHPLVPIHRCAPELSSCSPPCAAPAQAEHPIVPWDRVSSPSPGGSDGECGGSAPCRPLNRAGAPPPPPSGSASRGPLAVGSNWHRPARCDHLRWRQTTVLSV